MGMQIPLLSTLESKLRYVNQRERLLSENIANADTPNFMPQDLKPFTIDSAKAPHLAMSGLAETNARHLPGKPLSTAAFRPETMPDSEARLDGNGVVLEDEMSKMTEARIDFEAAIDFYQQSNQMISTALRAPGKPG